MVVAAIAILVACYAARILSRACKNTFQSAVVLSPSGITYHQGFRAKMIEWDSVEDIGVARGPGVAAVVGSFSKGSTYGCGAN